MPGRIVISSPQNRVKDTYAPAPKIDLTVRANGEEPVMVMDSLGNWHRAGLDAPTAAAVVTTTGAGSFTASKYWAYTYVYVAGNLYPLVENAVTGGGEVAPRSNPAPKSTADSSVNTNTKRLAIPTSSDSIISEIWVYRTNFFDDAPTAADFADAGTMFWIGSVPNNPNLPTVTFDDNGTAAGLEQVENDNFAAPQFRIVVFSDPFFWGFGNEVLEVPVVVTLAGVITLSNPTDDKWFNGRDAQVVTFQGITAGGYDNHGNFYIKITGTSTAQLYLDVALTQPTGLTVNGTTTAFIRGQSTVLYRSKPRNPFSWGYTDIVGEAQVPAPYTFSVGGGNGTAMAVIPNLNLLKLDVEAPNKCFVLNLKNAGTPNFESSLRIIADNYCVTNHHSQFSATLEEGRNVLWAIDSKSFAVIECDGSSQQPVSSPIFMTMRDLSLDAEDRLFFHGCYCPRLELNCMFIRIEGEEGALNKVVYQHGPTGFWGTMDVFDVLCSITIFDRFSGQMKMMVGTSTGFLGEMFADGVWNNWLAPTFDTSPDPQLQRGVVKLKANLVLSEAAVADDYPGFEYEIPFTPDVGPMPGTIGNWVTVVQDQTVSGGDIRDPIPIKVVYYARIATVANGGRKLTFDLVYSYFQGRLIQQFGWYPDGDGFYPTYLYVGLIEMVIGRTFTAKTPFDYKFIEEFWSAWRGVDTPNGVDAFPPTIEWAKDYVPSNPNSAFTAEFELQQLNNSVSYNNSTTTWGQIEKIPLDQAKVFGLLLRDRNVRESQLMAYELRLNPESNGGNN